MSSYKDNIRQVVPYVPGEQPKEEGIIKLNTNENPYPPAPGVRALLDSMDTNRFRLYPDVYAQPIVDALAEHYKLNKDEIFVGVGSDDVIAMAFMTFFNGDKPILFPQISYSFYSVWADLFKIPYKKVTLNADFSLNKDAFMQPNSGIIFPNPNAPTAMAVSVDFIEDVVKNNSDSVVIVDEAYIDFGGVSALLLIKKYENLLVVQTFSKSRSMAGMRIGFAMGNPYLIKALNDVKFSYNSYTMNMPTQILGAEAVKDDAYFKEQVKKIIATRERIKPQLEELGFTLTDSKANFFFATHKSMKAEAIFEALKAKKIYVRYFKQPLIDNYLRITIGTDEEMDKLVSELKGIIG